MTQRTLKRSLASLGALVFLTLAALALAAPPAGRKFAVLVGVKDYDHARLAALGFAVNDAVELGDLLGKHGYQVTLLRSGADDPRLAPTLANIQARLAELLKECKRHDTVLVGLAGHGLQFEKARPDDPDDAYFCPQDARPLPDRRETLLSLAKLYKQLDDSGAGVKLLLVDACRDDPTAPRGGRRGVDGSTAPRPPRGVAALFSCSAGESAYESPKLKHGVFFYYVLEGLKGKAESEGEVTWEGLQQYVRRRVSRDVAGLIGPSVRQTPALNAGELAGEPPILLKLIGKVTEPSAQTGHPAQVYVAGPAGMTVSVQKDKQFPPPFREVPCRLPLVAEATHRLKMSNIPRHPGVELYPRLKILKPDARSEAFLESGAIPIGVTEEDMEQVAGGKVVVKVVYLPKPEAGVLPPPDTPDGGVQVLQSAKLSEIDLVKQAARRGTVIAVFSLGNLDLESP